MDNNTFSNDTPTKPSNDITPEVSSPSNQIPNPTPNPTQNSAPNPSPTVSPASPESPELSKPGKQKRNLIIWAASIITVILVGVLGVLFIPKLFEKTNEPSDNPESPQQNKVGGLESIDFDFIKLENNSENIIYSPLSIRNGLALLQSGASGNTKDEIDNLLTDANIPKYQNITDKLSLANAIFIRNTFEDKVLPSYIETVQNNLNSEVLYDTFDSSVNMDNWVQRKTFNLIDSIGIQPTPNLEMVLANALAIQMDWKHQFDTDETFGNPFYQNDGTEIQTTTMHLESNSSDIKYYIDDDVTALSMPLNSTSKETNLDYIAIMPSGDLADYIDNIDTSKVENVINDLKPASEPKDGVVINIPKYKFDYELDFKNDLEKLGVKDAFNSNVADFSKIASEPLFVSDAIHKANIDFSEEGIKAAAITAFAMIANAMEEGEEPQPIIINIDHPFLFMIYDEEKGSTWFSGAVYQPNLWSDDVEVYRSSY